MTNPDIIAGSGSSSTNVAGAPPRNPSPQTLASPESQQQPPSPPAAAQQLQQTPPSFQPLFTLVTDSTSRATHHPRVHYIFSDDDPDVLTSALAQHHATAFEHDTSSPEASGGASRPERAIVLDLVPTETDPETNASGVGYDVAWASSLSADWAVTSARVSRIEEGEGDTEDDGAGRLMLRIEGVGISSTAPAGKSPSPLPAGEGGELQGSGGSGAGSGRQQASGVEQEDYGALIEEFEKRMGVLKKVVDAGDERRRKVEGDAAAAEAIRQGEAGEEAEDEAEEKD